MTCTPGCAFSQAARLSPDRAGNTSTGRWRSRSTRRVPSVSPRWIAQSSTPSTVGTGRAISGACRRRRNSVSGLTRIPRLAAIRAPASPPSATARSRSASRWRSVRRAETAAIPSSRSLKIRRGQVGLAQKNLRTWTCRRTTTPAHGRSASVRVARLWTRSAGSPQSGQRAAVASVMTRIVIPSSATRSASTRRDGGIRRAVAATMGHLRRPGGRTEAIVAESRECHGPLHLKCGSADMGYVCGQHR